MLLSSYHTAKGQANVLILHPHFQMNELQKLTAPG